VCQYIVCNDRIWRQGVSRSCAVMGFGVKVLVGSCAVMGFDVSVSIHRMQ
jgi:hypothetical protein